MNVCIIGISSSIGAPLARRALFQYPTVFGLYNKNKPDIKEASLHQCNLQDPTQISLLPKTIKDICYLVFCQGSLLGKSLTNCTDQEITNVVQINLTSTLLILKNFLAHHRFSKKAHICLISSIAAQRGSYDLVYSAAKAGLNGIMKSIIQTQPNLRANIIVPGLIEDSSMYKQMKKNEHQKHLSETPTQNLTTIDQLIEIILTIDKPMYNNMNGNVLSVDGGRYV